ncbi:MAG: hydroxymethylpyrimidine/phosphomethylpyrimidine kinase [Bacteroidales bacterium]|nr:hydroxymethylpyrimidine/phosphomethylpyrimidine kinase [Bacteroidales bacterium]
MSVKENMVLCLSGFDPTGGAGILADIKAIEAAGSYGMGVITANTIQTEKHFLSNEWIDQKYIIRQLKTLLQEYKFRVIKIGIIENLTFLEEVITIITDKNPDIKIVWDPVLKSTTGYEFHSQVHELQLNNILTKISLITPNIPEYKILFNDKQPSAISIGRCAVLLKGGHGTNNQTIDKLYIENKEFLFYGNKSKYSKHGSGCVLSSTIAGHLALDFSLNKACEKAKNYMNNFIISNKSLLGKHMYNYDEN